MIRKRAKTTFAYCEGCGGEKDFVEIKSAAELFGVAVNDLNNFVFDNAVHYDANGRRDRGICVGSLLEAMRSRQNGGGVRLIAQ